MYISQKGSEDELRFQGSLLYYYSTSQKLMSKCRHRSNPREIVPLPTYFVCLPTRFQGNKVNTEAPAISTAPLQRNHNYRSRGKSNYARDVRV